MIPGTIKRAGLREPKKHKRGNKSREQKYRDNTDRNVGEAKVPMQGKEVIQTGDKNTATGRDKNTSTYRTTTGSLQRESRSTGRDNHPGR